MTKNEHLALLQWYVDAGVDEAAENQPVNRLRPPPATSLAAPTLPTITREPARVNAMPRPASPQTHASPNAAIDEARALADAATTLSALRQAVLDFDGCALKKTATNTVFADGDPQSGLMLIGEAPGADEDKNGIPFCGISGKLLDQMFAAIGYPRGRFYVTNTLFWRPPGNRPPTPEELAICLPFLEKHIALVKPKRVVLIGGTAAKSMIDEKSPVTKLRGRDFPYTNRYMSGHSIPVRVTFHPSYLLRQSAQKKEAWTDLQVIKYLLLE
ncbi:MAG: uracil-DNA glycosylase [Rickettsiales bacterium]|nr:uracil-DNA glycosylase [Rickettsiales bacterium]